jgi:hypothetical protein
MKYIFRYAHEPTIIKYIKIAAMLPTKTIRDVALRCWWNMVNSFLYTFELMTSAYSFFKWCSSCA